MKKYILCLTVALACLTSTPARANQYAVISLACDISGNEVSIRQSNNSGHLLRKTIFGEKIQYRVDRLIYATDGAKLVNPISAEVEAILPEELEDLEEEPNDLWQALVNPARIDVSTTHAQTTVVINLSNNQILDLLHTLGSPTAKSVKEMDPQPKLSIKRYFPNPKLWSSDTTKKVNQFVEFSGWYGLRDLESCYQVDPMGMNYPNDPFFDGLAFHFCAKCKVDLLESTSELFAPTRSSLDPK